ncbi:MAG: M10 family metallopeptidase C-terminal domain-containing protein [Methyloceanibacter sp.]|uniref:M10 family metallopeptidase C-terminal domain-containing protein n=1 Tax=Methyloceanibacter sp. TaxID=1965321 RepID=UPI003D6C9EE3
MTIKLRVLTAKGVDINALIDHAKHGDPEPHGSSRFDLEDRGHNITLHATGSGFKYIGDVPTSGTIRQFIIDKGSSHLLDVDFSPRLKVSTALSGSGLENFFRNQPYELKGDDGRDKIRSGWKSDELDGRDGNDYLDGNRGSDTIDGGQGNDRLIGNKGNDVLIGGAGKDVMSSGTGRDRFVFEKLSDSKVSAADTILNFSRSQGDRVDLRGIDADTTQADNQAFTFVGDADFTNTAGELRFAAGVLEGDVNGDGTADFRVKIANIGTLDTDDFLL